MKGQGSEGYKKLERKMSLNTITLSLQVRHSDSKQYGDGMLRLSEGPPSDRTKKGGEKHDIASRIYGVLLF